METFDLSSLEKALSPKGRQSKKDLSPKPGLSKQELLDEAKRLAEDVNSIYSRPLRTRHAGDSYYIQYGDLHGSGSRWEIKDVPRQALEQLVVNGRRLLKDYYQMIEEVTQLNPELALEANLEGKTRGNILSFTYHRRIKQLEELLNSRVESPEVGLRLSFGGLVVKPPSGNGFEISVDWWVGRQAIVSGVFLNPRHKDDMIRLNHFLTYFEQVLDGVNRQLGKIKIKKEVTNEGK